MTPTLVQNESGNIRKIAKSLAPLLVKILMRRRWGTYVRLIENYLAFIQGKGSGAGWDLEAEIKVATRMINRSDAVIFDIGANRGLWSKRLLEHMKMGDTWKIFMIEPLEYCQDIITHLNLPNIVLVKAAASDKCSMANLYTPDESSPVASLHMRRDSYLAQYEFKARVVETITVDYLVSTYSIDQIDYLKMDVEGNEFAVLNGCRESIQGNKVKSIVFEFGVGNINSRTYFHDFWDLLHPAGFDIYRICPGSSLYKIKEYYEDIEYFRSVSNYLAVKS